MKTSRILLILATCTMLSGCSACVDLDEIGYADFEVVDECKTCQEFGLEDE